MISLMLNLRHCSLITVRSYRGMHVMIAIPYDRGIYEKIESKFFSNTIIDRYDRTFFFPFKIGSATKFSQINSDCMTNLTTPIDRE